MKSMLPNKDELSIRYVMQELDPSEQLMMEKAIAEDENLLIEVEALRSTYARTRENIPVYNAPSHVLDQVLTAAGATQKGQQKARVRYLVFRRISYAAAATVLFSAGFGWYTFTSGTETTPESVNAMVIPAEIQPASNAPWIDNRDVLHLNSVGTGTMALQPDSVPTRLRSVEEATGTTRPARQLQLTGSSQ